MKKINLLIVALVTLVTRSFSQSISPQVIASNGAFVSAGGYSLSYSSGQEASTTLTAGSSIVTQGFQQPNDVYTGLQALVTPTLIAQLYPNPAFEQVNLIINTSANNRSYTVHIVDLLGRNLECPLTRQFTDGQTQYVFDIRKLSSAIYFVIIKSSESNIIHSFKFNKIN